MFNVFFVISCAASFLTDWSVRTRTEPNINIKNEKVTFCASSTTIKNYLIKHFTPKCLTHCQVFLVMHLIWLL
jgi:hypothetical protein